MLEDILDGLFHIAKADGLLHEREGRFLHRIAQIFRIEENHYQSILARHAHLGDADPWLILGIERGSPFDEVKKRYRKLVAANHPDKLRGARPAGRVHQDRHHKDRRDQRRLRDDRARAEGDMSGFSPDHAGAEVRVSPNFGPRVGVSRPDMIILHYTGMKTARGSRGLALQRRNRRSPRTISCTRTAASCRWCARATAPGMPARVSGAARPTSTRIRSASRSSIRASSSATAIFPGGRSGRSSSFASGIIARHGILPQRVLAHSDVAPGRKIDPGEKFPWRKLAEAGVGHFVAPARAGGKPVLGPGDERRRGRGTAVHAVALWLPHRHHRPLR